MKVNYRLMTSVSGEMYESYRDLDTSPSWSDRIKPGMAKILDTMEVSSMIKSEILSPIDNGTFAGRQSKNAYSCCCK